MCVKQTIFQVTIIEGRHYPHKSIYVNVQTALFPAKGGADIEMTTVRTYT